MFRRKKDSDHGPVDDVESVDPDAVDGAQGAAQGEAAVPAGPPAVTWARVDGPWDDSEAPADEGRIDFGSLLVSPVDGLEVQVQADQATGQVSVVTLVLGQAAAQVQVFAAPKSSGLWDEIRGEIITGIQASGGQAAEVGGPFGLEIDARVQPSGAPPGLAPARFIGVDGPRWFLRAILLGSAAVQGPAAAAIESAVRGLVVARGAAAIGPRQPLPLRIPGAPEAQASVELPNPFERGPEITEIR